MDFGGKRGLCARLEAREMGLFGGLGREFSSTVITQDDSKAWREDNVKR